MVMLVTGGSRGIGAATARLAGARGYAVCVNYYRNRNAAETIVRDLEAAGSRAVAVQGDVANEEDVVRLFAAADTLGQVVGARQQCRRARNPDARRADVGRPGAASLCDEWVGAFLCAREAVRRMSRRSGGGGGAIVNVSSAAR